MVFNSYRKEAKGRRLLAVTRGPILPQAHFSLELFMKLATLACWAITFALQL
jgi:hypothetical protein